MRIRVRPFLVAILIALPAASLFLSAPAAAQSDARLVVQVGDVSVELSGDDELLDPEVEHARITFEYYVQIPPLSFCTLDITLHFKYLEGPEHAFSQVALNPPQIVTQFPGHEVIPGVTIPFVQPWGAQIGPLEAELTVMFTRSAPAFMDIPFRVQAQAHASKTATDTCNVTDSDPAWAQASLRPGYVADLRVSPQRSTFKAEPGESSMMPFEVVNLGNGPTRVSTTVNAFDPGLGIVAPPPLILESKATHGAHADHIVYALIAVQIPRDASLEGEVFRHEVTVFGEADVGGDPSMFPTSTQTFEFSVEVEPGKSVLDPANLPGFDGVALIAGLAIAAVALGRRRS